MTTPWNDNPKKKQPKSLATFLRHFIGFTLSVELKNGKTVQGTLTASDKEMNVTVDHVEALQGLGLPQGLHTVHIRGSTIRYIHFPTDLPLASVIKQSLARERAAAAKYQRVVRRDRGK